MSHSVTKAYENNMEREFERSRLENLHTECIVYLKIVHLNVIKKLFEILAAATGNIAICFYRDKIIMSTVNRPQQFIVHLELYCKDKKTYYFEEPCIMYINAREFYNDAFKVKDKRSILYLYVKREFKTNFFITYLSSTGATSTTFELVSREEDVNNYSFPTFQFTISLSLKSQLFHRLLSERKKTDIFEVIVHKRNLILNSERTLTSKRKDVLFEPDIIFPKLTTEMKRKLESPNSIGEYSVRKCNLFYKLPAIAEYITLHMNTDDPDEPFACEYKIGGDMGKLIVFFERLT
jgi:hypothetical protein